MYRSSWSHSVRGLASAALVGLFTLQPLSGVAQAQPGSGDANCSLPVLDLANPAPGDMLLPGAYTIQGLALDPSTPQGSGIDQVSFFLGDRDQGGIALGETQPTSGPGVDDFSLTVTVPSTILGRQDFVAYARSARTGNETVVKLPVVVGEDPSKVVLPTTAMSESNSNPGAVPSSCQSPTSPAMTSTAPQVANSPVASAPASGVASLVGQVATCQGGSEVPDSRSAMVQVVGASAPVPADSQGKFALASLPAPGTYTVTASDGTGTASRVDVSVTPGETLDIGSLDVGAGIYGCAGPAQ